MAELSTTYEQTQVFHIPYLLCVGQEVKVEARPGAIAGHHVIRNLASNSRHNLPNRPDSIVPSFGDRLQLLSV